MNNNAGKRFRFLKLANPSQTWVTQEAIDHISEQIAQRKLSDRPNLSFDRNAQPDERVLGSIKQTDLLIVNVHAIPPELNLSPIGRVEGRAALNSFGFMLRRAMSAHLDISPQEIRVGLRVTKHSDQIVGQVFLSDSLENGAGYCSHFKQPARLKQLLEFMADPNGDFLSKWLSPDHANCQTSCPDCLRDYANLAWHCILDWRLAVDMAQLALNASANVNLNSPHWQPLAATAIPAYFKAASLEPMTLAGLPAGRNPKRPQRVEVIIHPLWALNHPIVVQAENDARAAGISEPLAKKSLFEVLRRPF